MACSGSTASRSRSSGQGGDAARLRRARLHGRGLRRRAGAAGRGRPRHGPRPDQVRRPGRLRSLAARRCLLLLRRHDPHDRRRAGVGSGSRVAHAHQGGARRGDRAHPGGRRLPVGLRCGLRGLRGRGVSDPAHEDGGRGARPWLLPRARARRRPRGARGPVHGAAARRRARRRRRRHGRAGLLRPGDRRRQARRPRARDRRRLRGADPVPVRPRGRRQT